MASHNASLLAKLRASTAVDCDTLDVEGESCTNCSHYFAPLTHLTIPIFRRKGTNISILVAKKLGPFHDCTSNQAIAYFELVKVDENGKPVHEQLIWDSIKDAGD